MPLSACLRRLFQMLCSPSLQRQVWPRTFCCHLLHKMSAVTCFLSLTLPCPPHSFWVLQPPPMLTSSLEVRALVELGLWEPVLVRTEAEVSWWGPRGEASGGWGAVEGTGESEWWDPWAPGGHWTPAYSLGYVVLIFLNFSVFYLNNM